MTEAALQVEPEHWMAYSMQGRLAREDGDLDAAASYFRKVLAKKSDDANSRYCLGKMLLDQHKFEEAREELRAGLQYDPEHAMAEGARRAIALINESLGDETAQVSEDPNTYLLRAARYWKEGSYDRVIVQFNKALAIDPELAEAYRGRGKAYFRKQQYEQTIADFNKALEIEPKDAQIYNARGVAYAVKGQYDQAILDFTKALEIDPNYALKATKLEGVPTSRRANMTRQSQTSPSFSSGIRRTLCPVVFEGLPM